MNEPTTYAIRYTLPGGCALVCETTDPSRWGRLRLTWRAGLTLWVAWLRIGGEMLLAGRLPYPTLVATILTDALIQHDRRQRLLRGY